MALSPEPLVSIITPSFNQAQYLEQTIQSVLGQDYPRIEYIVIDGGSTDGSKAIIEKYAPQLSYWQSQKDAGQTDAINQGFARAKGDVLAWLNSDDILYPGAVSKAVEALGRFPEAVMVYGNCDLVNGQGKMLNHFPAAQTDLAKLRSGMCIFPSKPRFFWQRPGSGWGRWIPVSSLPWITIFGRGWRDLGRCSMLTRSPGRPSGCMGIPNPSRRMTAAGLRCSKCITGMGAKFYRRLWPSIGSANSSNPYAVGCARKA